MFGRRRKRAKQEPPPAAAGPSVSIRMLPSVTAARQAADGGSPAHMNQFGNRLKIEGRQNEAAEWYRKAADAGDKDAMANLALYLVAQGRNEEAAEWFRRAGGPLGEAFARKLLGMPDDSQER